MSSSSVHSDFPKNDEEIYGDLLEIMKDHKDSVENTGNNVKTLDSPKEIIFDTKLYEVKNNLK